MVRPRKFVEEEVVIAAAGAFVAGGYGGTTIEDLTRATGLGKQSLYNSFGGKRQLFLRALAASTTHIVDRARDTLAISTETPLDRVKAQLEALALLFSSTGPIDSLFTKATVELADRDDEVASAASDALRRLETEYRDCLAEARDEGQIAADADLESLATYFVAVTRGMEVLGHAGASRETLQTVASTSLRAIPLSGPSGQ